MRDRCGHNGNAPPWPVGILVEPVVEDGDRPRHHAVREVEDARRRVGQDKPQRGDRVDAACDEAGDDVRRHPVPPGVRQGRSRRRPAPIRDASIRYLAAVVVVRAVNRRRRASDESLLFLMRLTADRLAFEGRHELPAHDLHVVHALERLVEHFLEVDRVEEAVGRVVLRPGAGC